MSSPGTNASNPLPDVDERIVAPESGYEIDDGKLVRVPPCDPPHATCHAKLSSLLEAHVAASFQVALDMLTRTSLIDDLAPDASVFPRDPDPRTGGRKIEQLAFEIANTESLGHAGRKAAKLMGRGVRRVFAIDISRSRVLEWSSELATWSMLDPSEHLTDATLAVPLPIAALVDATSADAAVAHALVARRHPVIEMAIEAAVEQAIETADRIGAARGRIETLLAVLASRFDVPPGECERILRERDPARISRWITLAASCASIAELLAVP